MCMVAVSVLALVSMGTLPAQAASPPVTPTITEPEVTGQVVSGEDVHMETAPFEDPDAGDEHLCSDWEIWRTDAAERVWSALCIGGVQKAHVHFADGVFENSRAGETSLLPDTDYELRVRHRDDSGDAATEWSAYATRVFHTDVAREPLPDAPEWRVTEPGYLVEEVASGFQLPVNVVPAPDFLGDPDSPMLYVTELYGQIKVIKGDFTTGIYADDLLNFDPTGQFPGSGEQGVTGLVVEPNTGDLFATMLYEASNGEHYPKVVRFHSTDGGMTADTQTTILDMPGEPQGQSHQISNLTFGPDGALYVHVGDGFDPPTARNLESFRGKILRINLDGSPRTDNPFYNAGDGITARDYLFAYGFRNPFGGVWRQADGQHYSVENGPSVDRFARITSGTDYGWNGTNDSMRTNALYNWDPAHAPVNITIPELDKFHAAGFPEDKHDHAFVSESGPTYGSGPQSRGKRIVEFAFNGDGSVSGPTTLMEYNGTGKFSVAGLTSGPNGLYFTSLYPDDEALGPAGNDAKVFRVRYAPDEADLPPLTAYQHGNFQGAQQVFQPGVYDASMGELDQVGNDAISSLTVGPEYRVLVCAHDSIGRVNTSNLGLCRYYGPGQHSYVGDDFNDQISLISVFAEPAAGTGAVVYRDGNRAGASKSLGVGIHEAVAGELSSVGDNALSSLSVQTGHRAIVCDEDRSGGVNTGDVGLCRFFAAGNHNSVGSDLNDRASLVVVGKAWVTAYQHRDFVGAFTQFGPGMHEAVKSQLGDVGNDSTSSLRVPAGHRVVVCGDDSAGRVNTGSLGLCRFYGPGNHAFVGDLNDAISLLGAFSGGSSGSQLTAYQHRNFAGISTAYGPGIYQGATGTLGSVGNDSISSLRVGAGQRSVVCAHDSAGRTNTGNLGLCRYYSTGNHGFVGGDLNDQISLIGLAAG